MEEMQFKIDGPLLKTGVPIPIAVAALDSFQGIVDKTYLVTTNTQRITSREREKFFLRATEFKQGSLLTYFEIALQGVQLGLPLVSSLGPNNIWELTKDTFSFLKTVCGAVQQGKEPIYKFTNEADGILNVQIGDQNHHYYAPVYQIGQMALPQYQQLAGLIGPKKLNEISAGPKYAEKSDIYLGPNDRDLFKVPTTIRREAIDLQCEVFDFNKYKNAGKLAVKVAGQPVPVGEYNFTIMGNQDIVDYIYSMLKPQVVIICFMEVGISPFGGEEVHKLHVTSVGA